MKIIDMYQKFNGSMTKSSDDKVVGKGLLNFTLTLYKSPVVNLDFTGTFNYLADGKLITINPAELPELLNKGLIISINQKVKKLEFTPELFKDGFECRFLPDTIQTILADYRKVDSDRQRVLRENLRVALEELLSSHFGLQAVAFDTVYRNTSEEVNNAFKSVPLVHIDFPSNGRQRTLETFRREWEPRVLNKIGKNYHANNIEFMVNIWMPLGTITASPLVLCSRKKINPNRLFEYDAVRRDGAKFRAVSMTSPEPKKQKRALSSQK